MMMKFFSYVLVIILFIGGCMYFATPPDLRLEKVVIGHRLADSYELQSVQIIRRGKVLKTELDMKLKNGDEIKTDDYITAVVLCLSGAEVILDTKTHISLDTTNLLIRAYVGKVFVKGAWSVKTRYITAGVQGTEFLVDVSPESRVDVTVLEGSIQLQSMLRCWNSTYLRQSQKGVMFGLKYPFRLTVEKSLLDKINDWVRQIKKVLRRKLSVFFLLHEIAIQRDIRRIKLKQLLYLIDYGTYAENVEDLKIALSPGVNAEVISADDKDFEIEMTHDKLPGYLWIADSQNRLTKQLKQYGIE